MKNIKTGTFREARPGEKPLGGERDTGRVDDIDSPAGAIDAYRKFAARHGMPSLAVYPCCGLDVSPSYVFPKVVYIDNRPEVTSRLGEQGCDARLGDAIKIEVPEADLLIVMNPQVPLAELERFLKRGHLICNNYHGTADEAARNPRFSFCEELETNLTDFYRARRSAGYFVFRR